MLASFFAMQYGKLIGYWNCKVTNSSDIRTVQCDCEKILTDDSGDDDDNLLARGQTNEKIEEWFCPYPPLPVSQKSFNPAYYLLPYNSESPRSGVARCVFQPPRLS